MTCVHKNDEKWMRVAFGIARRGLGNVAPNPAVGCVLVRGDIIVGRGWTQPCGRPHAETEAIHQAGPDARGATAYVTLEPCAHFGKTQPCADALVAAGVRRVVIAVTDPDARVSGRGISILKAAGIQVITSVLEQEARTANTGFFSRLEKGRPSFCLKTASTLDGKIALANGDSKWITGERARSFGHLLRAEHDGILVGANTVIADNPSLNCRIPGLEHKTPRRIVLDSTLRIPSNAKVFEPQRDEAPVIIVTEFGADTRRYDPDKIDIIEVQTPHKLDQVASALGKKGINTVLVEGGSQVAASFLSADLIDIIYVFTAGKIIGNNGLGSVGDLNLASLPNAPHFTPTGIRRLGPDMLATYRKAE